MECFALVIQIPLTFVFVGIQRLLLSIDDGIAICVNDEQP